MNSRAPQALIRINIPDSADQLQISITPRPAFPPQDTPSVQTAAHLYNAAPGHRPTQTSRACVYPAAARQNAAQDFPSSPDAQAAPVSSPPTLSTSPPVHWRRDPLPAVTA